MEQSRLPLYVSLILSGLTVLFTIISLSTASWGILRHEGVEVGSTGLFRSCLTLAGINICGSHSILNPPAGLIIVGFLLVCLALTIIGIILCRGNIFACNLLLMPTFFFATLFLLCGLVTSWKAVLLAAETQDKLETVIVPGSSYNLMVTSTVFLFIVTVIAAYSYGAHSSTSNAGSAPISNPSVTT
ncbi:unnamed protein product [Didymodactylos carnosus]|uniref:Uncharacterized protein n=1 Tax=Didymodactylos carnosus TaxID=1234261 RepID=A0A815KY73_9BILA|nr:unnamed protein product [Didymodactylos carnosus]CAF4292970.1 unnamed protein product [Didymodactylos carnosus]